MKTGYYARVKQMGSENCIGISIGKCKFADVKAYYPKLAPTWDMVMEHKQNKDNNQYIIAYAKILSRLDAQQVWDELHQLTDNPILLCYEKVGDFCHRHLAAEWLSSELNVSIEEFKLEK